LFSSHQDGMRYCQPFSSELVFLHTQIKYRFLTEDVNLGLEEHLSPPFKAEFRNCEVISPFVPYVFMA
jgi:hypothetical protein